MGLKILAKASRKVLMTQAHLTNTTPTNTGRGIYCAQGSLRACYHLDSPRDINGDSFQTNGCSTSACFHQEFICPGDKRNKARREGRQRSRFCTPDQSTFFLIPLQHVHHRGSSSALQLYPNLPVSNFQEADLSKLLTSPRSTKKIQS